MLSRTVSVELHGRVGTPRARMGGELRRRVHPRRRGRLHRDRAEDEEGARPRGADHEGELQGERARQGVADREQPGVEEEEAAVPVQSEEHRRIRLRRRVVWLRRPARVRDPTTHNLIASPGPQVHTRHHLNMLHDRRGGQ